MCEIGDNWSSHTVIYIRGMHCVIHANVWLYNDWRAYPESSNNASVSCDRTMLTASNPDIISFCSVQRVQEIQNGPMRFNFPFIIVYYSMQYVTLNLIIILGTNGTVYTKGYCIICVHLLPKSSLPSGLKQCQILFYPLLPLLPNLSSWSGLYLLAVTVRYVRETYCDNYTMHPMWT